MPDEDTLRFWGPIRNGAECRVIIILYTFLDEIDVLTLLLQSKLLTAEEKRVRRVGAVAAHSGDVKLIAAPQAELSNHDATAASPATCIAERYVSPGGKTWYVRGNFGQFLGNFLRVSCAMMSPAAA
jgi:Sigma-54 interaction domain